MHKREINSPDAPLPAGGYAQAIEVTNNARTLYISGQIPVAKDGAIPDDFEGQCWLAWRNLEAQLHSAGMTFDNLVKVTVFLSDRAYALDNRRVRAKVLGERKIAMTVVIAGIFDESWLLEIEGIATA